MSNIPKAYRQGWIEFFKLRFKVNQAVLIPRPETELLVEEVLKFVQNKQTNKLTNHQLTILDLGTGSGCIAISLAVNFLRLHIGGVKLIASDLSPKALEVAKLNAKFHQVENQIEFIQSNLLQNISFPLIPNADPSSLILVANLPYIPSSRIPKIDPSVRDFEPHLALDGGKDGLDLYRKLFQQIKFKLPSQGWKLISEIDDTQGSIALKEAKKYFPKAQIQIKQDLSKRPRILSISLSF